MENSNVKAKYVYWCDEVLDEDEEDKYEKIQDKYKNIKNISELSHIVKEYNYGDLVSFSDYRDTGTYIIGKKGKLVPNPDNASAGYLSIPYDITKHLNNAVEMYCHDDLSVNDIDLRYDDKFIKDNINNKKCKILKKWGWQISYCVDYLYIRFPNGKSNDFEIDKTNSEQILAWYKGSEKEQAKFKINLELRDDDYYKYIKKFGENNYKWMSAKPQLPHDWQHQDRSSGGGHSYYQISTYYTGPLESKDQVINIINNFYEGFNLKCTEM